MTHVSRRCSVGSTISCTPPSLGPYMPKVYERRTESGILIYSPAQEAEVCRNGDLRFGMHGLLSVASGSLHESRGGECPSQCQEGVFNLFENYGIQNACRIVPVKAQVAAYADDMAPCNSASPGTFAGVRCDQRHGVAYRPPCRTGRQWLLC